MQHVNNSAYADNTTYNERMINKVLFALLVITASPMLALAEGVPRISAFSISPSFISNNYQILVSWTIENANAHSLYFNCPAGVTIKTTEGSSFPCNVRQSTGVVTTPNGSAGFVVTNVSGATKMVTATMYPKDATGVDNDAGAMSASFSVGTSAQPILEFSLSSTSIASNAPVTLTWKGVDAPGVNAQFDCNDNLRIYSDSALTTRLSCGAPAFTSDLPLSGSVMVYPANSSDSTVSILARIMPKIATGLYDATHQLTAGFSIGRAPLPESPSIETLQSSTERVAPGEQFKVSWSSKNAVGANMELVCAAGMKVYSVAATSTTALPCGGSAFASPLLPSGTLSLKIESANTFGSLTVLVMPQKSNLEYIRSAGRSLSISLASAPTASVATTVAPQTTSASQTTSVTQPAVPSTPIAAPVQTPAAAAPKAPPPTAALSSTQASGKQIALSLTLRRGSRGDQVTKLQEFLAQDTSIYPEASVTGYFGAATERALGRFQIKYGIAKRGQAGYGTTGPKTRAKINSILKP